MTQPKFKINKVYLRIVNSLLFFFTKYFRIRANITKDIENIDEPYLLLSNHVGTYDPFIISYFIKKPVHYVSSDAVMRDPKIGFIFKKWGVIPKKKNARDTQVIRDMITVAQQGGAIGLFPEGTRTWTGTSLPFDPVIAKLVKLLKIPVITAKMKGMQLSNPRWGLKLRRSTVEIDYQLAFTTEQIKEASLDEILSKITANITHDEVDYQRQKMNIIHSNCKAEYIEHVLFLCPSCKSIGEIKSAGNDFKCMECQYETHINHYGFFDNMDGKPLLFDNIRDGYNWQRVEFECFIKNHFKAKTEENIFGDKNVLFYKEIDEQMVLQSTVSLDFYIDRISISFGDGQQKDFRLKDIDMLNPQFHEKIEVTYLGENYRFIGKEQMISGLKWEIACSVVWAMTDEERKISMYLK